MAVGDIAFANLNRYFMMLVRRNSALIIFERRFTMHSLKPFALFSLITAGLLITGCGGTNQIQLDEVKQIAEEALRTANTADYHASQAKTMADETADELRQHQKMHKMKRMKKGRMKKDKKMHHRMMK